MKSYKRTTKEITKYNILDIDFVLKRNSMSRRYDTVGRRADSGGVAAVHLVVMATCAHHHVPTGSALHHRRTRLLSYHVLRQSGTPRAHIAHDQNLQQRGQCPGISG